MIRCFSHARLLKEAHAEREHPNFRGHLIRYFAIPVNRDNVGSAAGAS